MASHCKLPRPTGCTLPCHNRSVRQAEGGRFRLAGHNSAKLLYSPGFFRAGGEGRQVVLDVGSWEGHDLLSALAVPGMPKDQLRIHAFEPVPAIRTKLTAHMADMPQVFIHPHGIGSSNRTACFALDSGVRARELRPTATALQRPCASPASILDVAAAVEPHERVALLHMNCEGCEREVISRLLTLPASYLARIGAIELQSHHRLHYANGLSDDDYCELLGTCVVAPFCDHLP